MNFFTKKQQKSYKISGFSLIEMAVVLGVVGLITAGSVGMYSEQQTHVKWMEGDSKLLLSKASLLKFSRINKFLPCPDTDGDGLENRTGMACTANNGSVPFNDLGISQADVQDSWGNALRYAINQSATSATSIANCPIDSACFFNNTTIPAFDLTTLPVMGNAGTNNLRVCNTAGCNAATAGASIDGDALIAVLVSFNENGAVAGGLGVAEAENRDNDLFFVQNDYSESPYYDDLIQTISANELKDRYESEVIALVNNTTTTVGVNTNPSATGTVGIAGGTGDNDRFSDNIGVNIESTTIAFGAENAGQTVTLTFDAVIEGGWEDAGVNGGTPDTNRRGELETQDRFMVGLNGGDVSHLDDQLVNLDAGVAEFDGHQLTDSFFYDENLDRDNTWYEYASYNVVLDSNGELNIDFAVFSTHVSEEVTVSNINAVMYSAPDAPPSFPSVTPIPGIDQTDVFN